MFGSKIKHLLEIRDMNINELVEKTGLSRNLISGLVNDSLVNTSTDTIFRISKALRVKPGYFLDEDEKGNKGHAYTPLEALNLPNHIKDFIKKQKNINYLLLAQKLEDKNIPPEYVEKIVSAYEETIKRNK